MRFASRHDLVGEHGAAGRDERCGAVLLLECDRQSARLEQAEDVAGRAVRKPAFLGDDVVLGAVAGGDVILGDDRHQVAALDLEYFLGLALGNESAKLLGSLNVHGLGSQSELETPRFTLNRPVY